MDQTAFLQQGDLERLFALLRAEGYRTVGAIEEQGALVYREVDGAAALPVGKVDRQSPGRYRLEQQDHKRYFDWVGTAQDSSPGSSPPNNRSGSRARWRAVCASRRCVRHRRRRP
ncbi:hypothetical protein [Marinobacterium aestuariivivens]|uniref:Uncharacterized protein n=1 Tax=Marinobacterium aestuariivivens TaxID=1698799 RepID=A0ABW2A1S9_9GAMM